MLKSEMGEQAAMKLRGILAGMLRKIAPEACFEHAASDGGKSIQNEIPRASISKPLCRMIRVSALHHKQCAKDTKSIGHEIDPCDPRAASRAIDRVQNVISWRAEDTRSSYWDPEVSGKFAQWCEDQHGSEELGHARVA